MSDASLQQLLSNAAQNVQAGRFEQAKEAYRSVLERESEHPVALYGLGWIALQTGDGDAAVDLLTRAVAVAPSVPSYWYALGLARVSLGHFSAAIDAYRESVALNPNSARVCGALGTLLAQSRQFEEAVKVLTRAVELDPGDSRSWCNLGLALEDLDRKDEAVAALRRAFELDPNSKLIAYHLAAMGAAGAPAICPPEYVVQLFDPYADRFDEHLVGQLQYRGPQLMFEAVAKSAPGRMFDILDLGCGTGLCGVLFRPIASSLAGVDLAPRMIERSRARGVYDELIQADIVDAMAQLTRPFELLLAGDLFIYIGDLQAIFEAAARWLKPGGLFAFTIEFDPRDDFAVRPTRRYTHSLEYVRRLTVSNNFEELVATPATLRTHPDVAGYVVLLRSVSF